VDILSFVMRPPGVRNGWAKAALGAAVIGAGISVGWLIRGHVGTASSVESQTPTSVTIPGTDTIVTVGHGTVGELLAMDTSFKSQGRADSMSSQSCFEGDNLQRSWEMDTSRVQWIPSENRFEDGRLIDGAREGCWSFWYHDELFDSGRSGTYEKGRKVKSAPSPLGDFGYDEP
jgi:hypothetical protein